MTSLRARLFWILLTATGFIWISAVAWIFVSSRHEVEHVLDMRLQEAARMVDSLVETIGNAAPGLGPGLAMQPASYQRQLSCQIWSLDGRLMARSANAPGGKLTEVPSGFSDRLVDGEPWRVFAIEDRIKGVRILVGDRLGLRERLVRDLVEGVLTPALLIAPLLATLIWAALGQGLRPLRLAAAELEKRHGDDMRPLAIEPAPLEVRPLVASLNKLFEKLDASRRHERDLTAFAAHELRTPLAGLQTQAQVALNAVDASVREKALHQIVLAVERSTRLIRQLLTMSRLDASDAEVPRTVIQLGSVLREVLASTPTSAIQVIADPGLVDLVCLGDRESLAVAVRNLHENALAHSPPGGTVRWTASPLSDSALRLAVEDEGPGVPTDELEQVTDRFYRGRHRSSVGSGLGLAIVTVALRRCGATFSLSNRTDRTGLRVEVTLPVRIGAGG